MNVDIDSRYPLTDEQITAFRENGFIKLPHVLSPEVIDHYGREITRLTIELNTQTKPIAERDTYDKAFLQVMNLWQSSIRVREFVLGKRLGRIAAELLEVDGVRLYHDQSLYKEPGGGMTPAHADQYYWPHGNRLRERRKPAEKIVYDQPFMTRPCKLIENGAYSRYLSIGKNDVE